MFGVTYVSTWTLTVMLHGQPIILAFSIIENFKIKKYEQISHSFALKRKAAIP